MQQTLDLAIPVLWFVLESHHPHNPKHRPQYRVVTQEGLRGYQAKLLKPTGNRVLWRRLEGSWETEQEAQDFIPVHCGLRALTSPQLYAKALPPIAVPLECGCVVSHDKRRVKRCDLIQDFMKEAAPHLKDFLEVDASYREACHYKNLVDGHLREARKELEQLEKQRSQQP